MAGAVVFSLFFLMQHLIAISKTPLDEDELNRMLDFVRVPPEELVRPNKPKPKKPPPPDEPPPEPPPPAMDNVAPETQMQVSAAPVTTGINLDASGFGLSPGDGEYLPIVKVQPVYPERARARGIGGYVIVEFTVTRQGTTKDIRVVESEPSRIFDRAAMRAAAKFKYKPRIIDGNPIEVPGVQNKITFIMEE
ncbi:MAG: energy transducer TonB [Gammaproteobacteria bacterium]